MLTRKLNFYLLALLVLRSIENMKYTVYVFLIIFHMIFQTFAVFQHIFERTLDLQLLLQT